MLRKTIVTSCWEYNESLIFRSEFDSQRYFEIWIFKIEKLTKFEQDLNFVDKTVNIDGTALIIISSNFYWEVGVACITNDLSGVLKSVNLKYDIICKHSPI